MTELDRDIGRHDADIQNLKTEVTAIRVDLGEIKALLQQTKGGWKVLLAVATFATGVGAFLANLVSSFKAPHP